MSFDRCNIRWSISRWVSKWRQRKEMLNEEKDLKKNWITTRKGEKELALNLSVLLGTDLNFLTLGVKKCELPS